MDEAPFNGNVAMALAAAGRNGGGRVILNGDKAYEMASDTVLRIPDGVTLTSREEATKQATIQWITAAPRLRHSPKICTGPTSFADWETLCPPLVSGNGRFSIENVHIKAPATSALVGIMSPSKGAQILNSTLEVVGREGSTSNGAFVNVSNALC